jgi:hypothetical protein
VPATIFSGIKRLGHEADHQPPSNVNVRDAYSYTFTPPYVLWSVASSNGDQTCIPHLFLTVHLVNCRPTSIHPREIRLYVPYCLHSVQFPNHRCAGVVHSCSAFSGKPSLSRHAFPRPVICFCITRTNGNSYIDSVS